MSDIVLPVLGGEGWLTDGELIMNKLFIHMFLTDHSQSNIYQGSVTSLQYILAEHGNDIPELVSAVSDAVTRYYRRYFQDVVVNFKSIATDDDDTAAADYTLYISGSLNGTTYDLSKTLQVDNTQGVSRFIEAFV
jgi:hypothetical protein